MLPTSNKANHLVDARANSLIRKKKHMVCMITKESRRDVWDAMSDILKEEK